MRLLIIGGTRFVGLAMARAAIARGHEVSLFHRGQTTAPDLAAATNLIGDRTKDFTALQVGEWDAVLDVCGYRPHEINALYDVFAGRIGKYAFISTVSVYDHHIPAGADETAQLASTAGLAELDLITCAIDGDTYGPLKVLCETAVQARYQDSLLIRPTYVIGHDDYTNRFTKWVELIKAGGTVDVPEPKDSPMQYIDARDLANFTIHAIEQDLQGPYHCAAPSGGVSFSDMMQTIISATGSDAKLNWLSIEEAKPRAAEFPFWAPSSEVPIRQLNTAKATAAGLAPRPLAESIKDL